MNTRPKKENFPDGIPALPGNFSRDPRKFLRDKSRENREKSRDPFSDAQEKRPHKKRGPRGGNPSLWERPRGCGGSIDLPLSFFINLDDLSD